MTNPRNPAMDNAQVTQMRAMDTFAHFTDLMDDDALERYRDNVRSNDGHEMAVLNHNSLRRIIARLDRAEETLARHRLERSEPVGWMGIESAPKDGTRIDLWIGGEYPARYPDAYWGRPEHTCGEAGRYCDCCPSYDGWVDGTLNCYLTGDDGMEDEPTHWMPLPSAPGTTHDQ